MGGRKNEVVGERRKKRTNRKHREYEGNKVKLRAIRVRTSLLQLRTVFVMMMSIYCTYFCRERIRIEMELTALCLTNGQLWSLSS